MTSYDPTTDTGDSYLLRYTYQGKQHEETIEGIHATKTRITELAKRLRTGELGHIQLWREVIVDITPLVFEMPGGVGTLSELLVAPGQRAMRRLKSPEQDR